MARSFTGRWTNPSRLLAESHFGPRPTASPDSIASRSNPCRDWRPRRELASGRSLKGEFDAAYARPDNRHRLRLEEPMVLAGDYNVIPMPADAKRPEAWVNALR